MSFPFLLAILTPQAIVAVIAIPVSLMVGFAFGLIYERWYHASQLQRTSKRFEKLFAHVSGCLDKTEQACRLLREKAVDAARRDIDQIERGRAIKRIGVRTGCLGRNLQLSINKKTQICRSLFEVR